MIHVWNKETVEEFIQLLGFLFCFVFIGETRKTNHKTKKNLEKTFLFFVCCQDSTFLQLTNLSEKDLEAWKHILPGNN